MLSEWGERHQVTLFLAAIAVGATLGLLAPSITATWEPAITPVLGLLLYATFLGVPFRTIARSLADLRFLGTLLVVNFVAVPVLAFGLSRVVASDHAVLAGVLLVLLAPCIDYVIVFAGLAGGDRARLLAATPMLMVLQVALIPVFLVLMAGPDVAEAFDPQPFIDAFLLLIVLPLTLAAATQWGARRWAAVRTVERASLGAMVPLMMITLAVVVGSHAAGLRDAAGRLLIAALLFAAFVPLAAAVGVVVGRAARLDLPARRAVVFSGVTRNSLVVLPLALALPGPYAITPLVVVTQTVVELLAMATLVAFVPRVLPARAP